MLGQLHAHWQPSFKLLYVTVFCMVNLHYTYMVNTIVPHEAVEVNTAVHCSGCHRIDLFWMCHLLDVYFKAGPTQLKPYQATVTLKMLLKNFFINFKKTHLITLKFCTYRDSCAVCAKFQCDQINRGENISESILNEFWNSILISLRTWAPVCTTHICWHHKKEVSCHQNQGHVSILTHCGLVMPYGDIELDQHCSGNGLLPDNTKP